MLYIIYLGLLNPKKEKEVAVLYRKIIMEKIVSWLYIGGFMLYPIILLIKNIKLVGRFIKNGFFELGTTIKNSKGYDRFAFIVVITATVLTVGVAVINAQKLTILIKVLAGLFTMFLLYLGFSFIIYLVRITLEVILGVKDTTICIEMVMSFAIILIAMIIAFSDSNSIVMHKWLLLAAGGSSYFLNMRMIIKIIANPYNLINENNSDSNNSKKEKNNIQNKGAKEARAVLFSSVFIIVLTILSLFLFVAAANEFSHNAYSTTAGQTVNAWSLLYYTVISFTTVGYGDIIPCGTFSRIVSVFISITSVLSLIVFIGAVMPVKETLLKNVNKKEDMDIKRELL